ncbi:MAG TPA: hemerythrin family protein [Anaeromyxobacteraceae bacterium]|nr:hemerythrin family protein [Anaeromyxobacteraceae bacterium]
MTGQPLFFCWKAAYELGLPELDAQHRQFFELMNRCAMAAAEGAGPAALDELLSELAAYADYHFSAEEAVLDRCGYPGLEQQRAEHRRFRADLARLVAQETPSVLATLTFTRDWLLGHVLGADRRYVDWVAHDRHGVYAG